MMLDAKLTFNSALGTPQAITTTADSSVIDITGAGVGNAPGMSAGTSSNQIGADIGQGEGMAIPYVVLSVIAAFDAGATPTLQISLKAAPRASNNTEGTYDTLYTSEAFTGTQLAAGAYFFFPVPPRARNGQPGESLPCFYKLTYTVASGPFTTGTMLANMTFNPPSGLINTLYPSNFTSV